jgi:hypothetical protein
MTSLEPNRDPESGTEMLGQLTRERSRRRLMLLFMLLTLVMQTTTQLSYRVVAGSGFDGLQSALANFLLEFSIWTFCNLVVAGFATWRAASIINGWSFIACFVVLSWITFFGGGTLYVFSMIGNAGVYGVAAIGSLVAIYGMALTVAVSLLYLIVLGIRRAWARAMA